MINNFKKTVITTMLGAALSVAGTSAFALLTWHDPVTKFEDDNMEWFFDNDGNGRISVGDRIVSVYEINQTVGAISGGPTPIGPDQELTGILDVTVTSATALPGGLFSWEFGPSGGAGLLGGFGPGALTAAWLDNTPNLDIVSVGGCTDLAACAAAASDGALWEVDGFGPSIVGSGPDNPYFFVTTAVPGADNPSAVLGIDGSTNVAIANYGYNVMFNGTGRNLVEQTGLLGKVDVVGSGTVQGGQGLERPVGNPDPSGGLLFARSDFDFQKAVQVPEPGSLALLGIGLLGLLGFRNRK